MSLHTVFQILKQFVLSGEVEHQGVIARATKVILQEIERAVRFVRRGLSPDEISEATSEIFVILYRRCVFFDFSEDMAVKSYIRLTVRGFFADQARKGSLVYYVEFRSEDHLWKELDYPDTEQLSAEELLSREESLKIFEKKKREFISLYLRLNSVKSPLLVKQEIKDMESLHLTKKLNTDDLCACYGEEKNTLHKRHSRRRQSLHRFLKEQRGQMSEEAFYLLDCWLLALYGKRKEQLSAKK
ncbi:MAG: hypothetical protein H6728_14775 [Myxococcales bacterium]|nr:hypothetical protein [Myxococcales bacterium]MCB9644334.1 hypothetical protein [Myxococcales bacterium]